MSSLLESKEDAEKRLRDWEKDHWRKLAECDWFDVEKGPIPYHMKGLREFDCEGMVPFRALVTLYAKVGLHRYNMWQMKNLKLSVVKKFNMEMGFCASNYFITLDAKKPASRSHQTFQVLVAEESLGRLDLKCYITRPKPKLSNACPLLNWYQKPFPLPDWPLSLNAFNDENRFYLVKKSDLRDHDWIPLYLKLAVCSHNRFLTNEDLSKLKILGVAIETNKEDLNPPYMRLIAKTANVYICFKDLLGKDRRAIFTRIIDETTGYLTLKGDILSEDKPPSCLSFMAEIQNVENKASSNKPSLRHRLGIHRLWRLSSPRPSHVYKKKHGVRSPIRRLSASGY